MFIKLIVLISMIVPVDLFLTSAALCAPIDDWNAIILDGSHSKFDGKYNNAIQSFTKAVSFAEKQKLPNKCLPISLCRLAEVQLISNNVKEGDSHFEQITNLIKTQKASNTLDPQVSFWAAALADAYQGNHKPGTQELCLKHACYLKNLTYGSTHKECTDCLTKLAEFYIDDEKVDKAIKILNFTQALSDKQFGKNPYGLGDRLNNLAIKCKNEKKYLEAEQLELAVIKLAKTNKSALSYGLPAFYCFLGLNSLAQEKSVQSKEYFSKAMQECSKIKGATKKCTTEQYLRLLVSPCMSDSKKPALAESEFRQLLSVNKAIPTSLDAQYTIDTLLAGVLSSDPCMDYREHTRYIQQAIDIANLPNSPCRKDLPDLYMRLGLGIHGHNLEKGNEAFNKALKAEKEPVGYHSTLVLYFWGIALETDGKFEMSVERLNSAYKQACALPADKRGTLLADLLQRLALDESKHGKEKQAQSAFKRSAEEIQLQKKLHSKLGPDFYHRL